MYVLCDTVPVNGNWWCIYSNIIITINLIEKETDEEEMEEFPLMDPPVNREGYGNLVLNPRRRIAERMPAMRLSITV